MFSRKQPPAPRDDAAPRFDGWRLVKSGLVIQALHSGFVFNAFSLFSARLRDEFGWSNALLGGAFALNRLESGLLGPLQGWMTDKWGPKVVLRIGAVVMAVGLLLFSQLQNVAQFYGFYLLVAMGSSLAGFLSITVAIVNWFERKRSRALAFSQVGFAIGGALAFGVGLVMDMFGWRWTAAMSAVIVLVVIFPLSSYFVQRPSLVGQHVDGITPEERAALPDPPNLRPENRPTAVHFTASEAMRTRAFWFISFGHGSALLVVGAAMAHLAPYLEETGFGNVYIAVIVGILPVMMGVGQLTGGYLGDRYNKRLLVSIAMLGHGLGLFALAMADSGLLVWVFVVVHGLSWGVRGPLQQAMRADYFGATDFGKIMGFSSLVVMTGMVVGPIMAGYMRDWTGSFTLGFVILAVAAASGSLWFWFATPPAPPERPSAAVVDGIVPAPATGGGA